MAPSLFVSLLLYNTSAEIAARAISSIIQQSGFVLGKTLSLLVSDNSRSPDALDALRNQFSGSDITFHYHGVNLGFCGGHNFAVARFLEGNSDIFITLNPDLVLEPNALLISAEALSDSPRYGSACIKLLRSDESSKPLNPPVLDSAGIVMTPDLRHFDRGAEAQDSPTWSERRAVFGGTGACLLLRKEAVIDGLLRGAQHDKDLYRVYPELESGASERQPLFDEGFFAYREDVDLAWRLQRLGWRCLYVSDAVGYHQRRVTPERRAGLPSILNKLGVRNRFLLQINNYHVTVKSSFMRGFLLRNILVIGGVLVTEWSSLRAFYELLQLARRAFERRAVINRRAKIAAKDLERWFQDGEYTEGV